MPSGDFLLVNINNSFTKLALSSREALLETLRVATPEFSARHIPADWRFDRIAVASVVPKASDRFAAELGERPWEVLHTSRLGIGVELDHPEQAGADRLCNAVACAALHAAPAIVVDFGTAVSFDVVSSTPSYLGGAIAPGLHLMTDYLHERTALLPKLELRQPTRVVGKSTTEAMLTGAFYGYRGLIREITAAIREEVFDGREVPLIATGGQGAMLAEKMELFDRVDPDLTLQGLRLIAERNLT